MNCPSKDKGQFQFSEFEFSGRRLSEGADESKFMLAKAGKDAGPNPVLTSALCSSLNKTWPIANTIQR